MLNQAMTNTKILSFSDELVHWNEKYLKTRSNSSIAKSCIRVSNDGYISLIIRKYSFSYFSSTS